MRAYKLMRLKKNGALTSLFIDKKTELPIGVWLDAKDEPTKGYAHRPAFHCAKTMDDAPHLSMNLKNGEQRVWCEVEVEDYHFIQRPKSQGDFWILAKKMKIVRKMEDTCDICGHTIGKWRINPYDEDVKGEENWQYICLCCLHDLCDDI